MSDPKFEKQVQQKMDELRIPPSPAAWEAIESGLRLYRRRSVPVWAPLLLILLAGGSYFFFTHTRKVSQAVVRETAVTPNAQLQSDTLAGSYMDSLQRSEKPRPAPDFKAPEEAQASNTIRPQEDITAVAENKKPSVNISDDARPLQERKKDSRKPKVESGNSSSGTGRIVKPPDEDAGIAEGNDRSSVPAEVKKDPELEHNSSGYPKREENKALNNAEEYPKVGSADRGEAAEKKETKKTDKKPKKAAAESKPVTEKKKKQERSWQWGINASAGVSLVNEGGVLNFRNTAVQDISLSAPSTNAPISAAPGLYVPSDLKPGLAYSIGFIVKKDFPKGVSLSTGIAYTQYNTKTEVGKRIDRNQIVSNGNRGYLNVSSYYLGNQVQEYRNRYHFIEIPLTLHLRMSKDGELPIYWNGGVSVLGLLSSNNLHFDGTTGVYYRNNSLLSKVQAGAHTGFSFVLFNKRSFPLWIGPGVRYNASSLLKKDVSESKHLLSPGIDIKLFFKK